MREVQEPTLDQYGGEVHPAFGLIGASRVSSSPPGAVLFDSDLQHQHYVVVKVSTASRKRDLNHDWLHPAEEGFVEVSMSEAQWASFVSTMNTGSGVPCTITRREKDSVPGVPFQPRLGESVREVEGAAAKAVEEVTAAFEAYREHKTAANLRTLEYTIKNMPSNLTFTATSLSKHTENVVQKARADIEAFVVAKATQLGIEASDLGSPLALTQGDPADG